MKKNERAAFILDKLNKLYPDPSIPLQHNNIFELLIAVLLSAQCTAVRAARCCAAIVGVPAPPAFLCYGPGWSPAFPHPSRAGRSPAFRGD